MASASEYPARAEKVLGAPFRKAGRGKLRVSLGLQWEDVAGARRILARIRQMQKEIRLIIQGVNKEMKIIRSASKARSTSVQAGFIATLGGKRAAGRDRARQRESLRRQKEHALAPYEQVKDALNQVVVVLDGYKLEVESWIEANKGQPVQAPTQEGGARPNFCSQCGTKVGKQDSFCHNCGASLS